MTHGPELPLPTARVLQGWWRELEDRRPRRLWFGRLLFHHLDACIETAQATVLDPLQRAMLRALAAGESRLATFDSQLRSRLLHELIRAGLVGADGVGWSLTPTGRTASTGSFLRSKRERRSFWFVDNSSSGKPPRFLLPRRSLEPVAAPEGWSFPVEALVDSVRQPETWKQRHHFPADVLAIVDFAAPPSDWRSIVVDRAEQFLGVVVETDEGLTAYSVQTAGWVLDSTAPVFTLAVGWEEVLDDLGGEADDTIWRQAWLAWCQTQGIVDADNCSLERDGHRLLIKTSNTLAEHLRTEYAETFQNEAWLLAGTGRLLGAAQLVLESPEKLATDEHR